VSPNRSAHDGVQDTAAPRLDAMDTSNGVEAVIARLSASPSGLVYEADGVKSVGTTGTSTPNGIRSSPPPAIRHVAMTSPEDAGAKSDSEAETIVLPGKDGHSPSKIRKSIKHEDKSDDDGMGDAPGVGGENRNGVVELKVAEEGKPSEASIATSMLGKRKRSKHGNGLNKDDAAHHGNSSGLSSVPTSPVAAVRSSFSKPAPSDSDISRSPSPNKVRICPIPIISQTVAHLSVWS